MTTGKKTAKAAPVSKPVEESHTNARLQGNQTLITYVVNHIGALHMLELAETMQTGQPYTAAASMIYSAFTLEAYFNHLGQERNKDWECIECKIRKLDKFKRFAKEGNLVFDINKRPYSTLVELFDFRDTMAHGRTVKEEIDREIDWREWPAFPRLGTELQWMSFATPEQARKGFEDTEKIIRALHAAFYPDLNPFLRASNAFFAVTRTSPNQAADSPPVHQG